MAAAARGRSSSAADCPFRSNEFADLSSSTTTTAQSADFGDSILDLAMSESGGRESTPAAPPKPRPVRQARAKRAAKYVEKASETSSEDDVDVEESEEEAKSVSDDEDSDPNFEGFEEEEEEGSDDSDRVPYLRGNRKRRRKSQGSYFTSSLFVPSAPTTPTAPSTAPSTSGTAETSTSGTAATSTGSSTSGTAATSTDFSTSGTAATSTDSSTSGTAATSTGSSTSGTAATSGTARTSTPVTSSKNFSFSKPSASSMVGGAEPGSISYMCAGPGWRGPNLISAFRGPAARPPPPYPYPKDAHQKSAQSARSLLPNLSEANANLSIFPVVQPSYMRTAVSQNLVQFFPPTRPISIDPKFCTTSNINLAAARGSCFYASSTFCLEKNGPARAVMVQQNDCWKAESQIMPQWFECQLPLAYPVGKLLFQVIEGVNSSSEFADPSSFRFEGKATPDHEWVALFLVNNAAQFKGKDLVFNFDNRVAFRYYRLIIFKTMSSHPCAKPLLAGLRLMEYRVGGGS